MKRTIVCATLAGLLGITVPAVRAQPPAPKAPERAAERMAALAGSRSFLGVGVVEVTSERTKSLKLSEERGVEITKVDEGSPAERAGLKVGDVVTEFNGQRVEGTEQFIRFVRETPAGRGVKLTVLRNGNVQTVTATTEARKLRPMEMGDFQFAMPRMPELPELPRAMGAWHTGMLGIEAESVSAQLAEFFGVKEGVLVRSVGKNSVAEKAGIKAGDVITKVDDRSVRTPADVTRAINSSKERIMAVTIVRERREIPLSVKIEETRVPRGRAAELQRF